jgi:hypothetical protein
LKADFTQKMTFSIVSAHTLKDLLNSFDAKCGTYRATGWSVNLEANLAKGLATKTR